MQNYRVANDLTYHVAGKIYHTFTKDTTIVLDERYAAMVNAEHPGTLEIEAKNAEPVRDAR